MDPRLRQDINPIKMKTRANILLALIAIVALVAAASGLVRWQASARADKVALSAELEKNAALRIQIADLKLAAQTQRQSAAVAEAAEDNVMRAQQIDEHHAKAMTRLTALEEHKINDREFGLKYYTVVRSDVDTLWPILPPAQARAEAKRGAGRGAFPTTVAPRKRKKRISDRHPRSGGAGHQGQRGRGACGGGARSARRGIARTFSALRAPEAGMGIRGGFWLQVVACGHAVEPGAGLALGRRAGERKRILSKRRPGCHESNSGCLEVASGRHEPACGRLERRGCRCSGIPDTGADALLQERLRAGAYRRLFAPEDGIAQRSSKSTGEVTMKSNR